jgi:hypothetical protein
MRSIKRFGTVTAICAVLLALPASAAAAPDTWGQEVQGCNATSCYPEGSTRGGYVSAQAKDSETPGYAWEVQSLALDPRDLGNGGF